MKATQLNTDESEHDRKFNNSEQEKDSNHPRPNKELLPKRESPFVAQTWYEKSDMDQKMTLQIVPHNRLKKHFFLLLPPMQELCETVQGESKQTPD